MALCCALQCRCSIVVWWFKTHWNGKLLSTTWARKTLKEMREENAWESCQDAGDDLPMNLTLIAFSTTMCVNWGDFKFSFVVFLQMTSWIISSPTIMSRSCRRRQKSEFCRQVSMFRCDKLANINLPSPTALSVSVFTQLTPRTDDKSLKSCQLIVDQRFATKCELTCKTPTFIL